MSADVIATACDALIKEDSAAPITRSALESIIGDVVKNTTNGNTVWDVPTSQNVIDWLLAVAIKYKQEAEKTYWNKKIERLNHVPKFITWAHEIWSKNLQGHESATFHHLDRLFNLSRGSHIGNETHAFIHGVLSDGLQRKIAYTSEEFSKLNVWGKVGELGMSSSRKNEYQQLYTTYVHQHCFAAPWSTLGRVYLFDAVLDYVCNTQNTSLREIIAVIDKNGYHTPLSTSEFTRYLINHATTRNEDIVKVLEDNQKSAAVVELFKDTGFDLRIAPNQVWGVQQLDYLNKVPTQEFNAVAMVKAWSTHSTSTRFHNVTLALLSKITAYDIKNKIKSLIKDENISMDDIVEACLADAIFFHQNPPQYYLNAAQVVLKKLENGALWSELSPTSHRAIFDQLSTHVTAVLETPLNEKGVQALSATQARTLGSHIHIVHRSLRSTGNLITTDDARVAKHVLLAYPQINPQTQLLNMVKLIERGLVAVEASDVDVLQSKLNNTCTAELLALASASVRPQAATPSKRRL